MRYGFIRERQKAYPITVLCAVMQVSASAHYAWAKRPGATGQAREAQAFDRRVARIFEASRQAYGSRRTADELRKGRRMR